MPDSLPEASLTDDTRIVPACVSAAASCRQLRPWPSLALAPQPRKKGLSVGAIYQHLPTSYPPPRWDTERCGGGVAARVCLLGIPARQAARTDVEEIGEQPPNARTS
jgi:hypothetical protein